MVGLERGKAMDLSCKRCLLREMDDESMYHRIQRTVDAIPEELRCPDRVYAERLAACRECDRLISGMCRVCGCFVEVRAAKASEHCPGQPRRWERLLKGSVLPTIMQAANGSRMEE